MLLQPVFLGKATWDDAHKNYTEVSSQTLTLPAAVGSFPEEKYHSVQEVDIKSGDVMGEQEQNREQAVSQLPGIRGIFCAMDKISVCSHAAWETDGGNVVQVSAPLGSSFESAGAAVTPTPQETFNARPFRLCVQGIVLRPVTFRLKVEATHSPCTLHCQ